MKMTKLYFIVKILLVFQISCKQRKCLNIPTNSEDSHFSFMKSDHIFFHFFLILKGDVISNKDFVADSTSFCVTISAWLPPHA